MVAKFLDLNIIFLTETAIRIGWATVLILSAIMHRKAIDVNFSRVFFFFGHICRARVCWDPEILLPWQRDATASPLYSSHSDILLFLSKQVYFQNSSNTTICQKRREWGKEEMVPIGFFNPVIPTQIFAQSPNPEGYFQNPPSRAHFQSRILPPFSFEIPNLIQYNNFI